MLAFSAASVLRVSYILEQNTANTRDVSTDEELLMSPGMDATIFLEQICINYIPYFPFPFFNYMNF